MALELAQMARWEGDDALAQLLDKAAELAAQIQPALSQPPIETVAPLRRPA